MKNDGKRRPGRTGIILIDTCITIVILGVALACVSMLLAQYGRAADYYQNRLRVQWAAESRMDRLRAANPETVSARTTDTTTGVIYEIVIEPAPAPWAPLRRASVTAEVTAHHGRRVRFTVHGLLPPPGNGGEHESTGGDQP